jgi:hypothetical protein
MIRRYYVGADDDVDAQITMPMTMLARCCSLSHLGALLLPENMVALAPCSCPRIWSHRLDDLATTRTERVPLALESGRTGWVGLDWSEEVIGIILNGISASPSFAGYRATEVAAQFHSCTELQPMYASRRAQKDSHARMYACPMLTPRIDINNIGGMRGLFVHMRDRAPAHDSLSG